MTLSNSYGPFISAGIVIAMGMAWHSPGRADPGTLPGEASEIMASLDAKSASTADDHIVFESWEVANGTTEEPSADGTEATTTEAPGGTPDASVDTQAAGALEIEKKDHDPVPNTQARAFEAEPIETSPDAWASETEVHCAQAGATTCIEQVADALWSATAAVRASRLIALESLPSRNFDLAFDFEDDVSVFQTTD